MSGRGNEPPGFEFNLDQVAQVQLKSLNASRGEDNGIIKSCAKTIDSCGHIASQGLNVEVWSKQQKLITASHRGGAHLGALAQGQPSLMRLRVGTNQQNVCGCSTGRNGGDGQPIGLTGLKVFVAVHSQIHALLEKGLLNLFGKKTFAFEFLERLNLLPVSLSGQHSDVAGATVRFNEVSGVVGLPQGEITAASANLEVWRFGHGLGLVQLIHHNLFGELHGQRNVFFFEIGHNAVDQIPGILIELGQLIREHFAQCRTAHGGKQFRQFAKGDLDLTLLQARGQVLHALFDDAVTIAKCGPSAFCIFVGEWF